ncbi:MAG: energy-coupling factor transporter ATPase [Firmicutes bacterium]|nr:energy-coupling factor transporter ATPase [Bacillota bacterium]
MSFIEAKDLVHEYIMRDEEGNVEGVQVALDHLDLNVEQGQFIAVLGHNGSGKSTFAKHLNALLMPSEGTLYVGGMDVSDENLTYDIRQTAGMVFQNPDNQIVSSVVEDDVAFGPENIGVEPSEIRRRVEDALRRVDMYQFRDKGPHHLSGGQKQRVAIASAYAMLPECIVFDEPTAMLDPKGRREVLSIVEDLNRQGITTILITHFMEEAACADKIIVMDSGRLVLEGNPEEVFRHGDELQRLSLGVPPAVMLAAKLRERGIGVPDDVIDEEGLVRFLCQDMQE